jgi:hypothetical protein
MGWNFHWSMILAYGCSMRRARSRRSFKRSQALASGSAAGGVADEAGAAPTAAANMPACTCESSVWKFASSTGKGFLVMRQSRLGWNT